MKKVLLYFVLIISGCQNSSKIIGHWHIYSMDEYGVVFFPMDIINDTLAYVFRNTTHQESEGVLILNEKKLNFPGECGAAYFNYRIKDNDIYLKNKLGGQYKGYKCDSLCCTNLEDYTNEFLIDIDFPILNTKREGIATTRLPLDRNYVNCIIIGRQKQPNQKEDSIRIETSGIFLLLEDIGVWVSKVMRGTPESRLSSLTYEIIADKHVPTNFVKKVIDKLYESGAERIFLTCKNEDLQNKLFEYIFVETIDWSTDEKVEAIVK